MITLHEFTISGDDAWVTANKNIPVNLSRYGGAYNGALIDSAVQEYDLRTGRLLRNWDAMQHIPLSESKASLPTNGFPWDAYHVNSIDLVGGGAFLVSMRNTWGAYMVDIATGRIEWTLGGKHSSFTFGKGAAFQWQHDVQMQSGSTVSLYDDHCCQLTGGGTYVEPTGPSRGLLLRIDQRTHTATLIAQYVRAEDFNADYMGDTEPLSNGNVFIGWGSDPYFSEYSRSGRLLFEGEFPAANLSYRTTLEQWVGLPLSRPPAPRARAQARRSCTRAGTARPSSPPGACSRRTEPWPLGRRRERREDGLRDGAAGALRLQQLQGPGARRERPRARDIARVRAVGSRSGSQRAQTAGSGARAPGRPKAACSSPLTMLMMIAPSAAHQKLEIVNCVTIHSVR